MECLESLRGLANCDSVTVWVTESKCWTKTVWDICCTFITLTITEHDKARNALTDNDYIEDINKSAN